MAKTKTSSVAEKRARAHEKRVIVTLDDDGAGRIEEVAQSLEAKGLHVERTMPALGVIAGLCSAGKMQALSKIDGVESVEEEFVANPSH